MFRLRRWHNITDHDDDGAERKVFVENCYKDMLQACTKHSTEHSIQRDYAVIPMFVNDNQVVKDLKQMIKNDSNTDGYVHVYVTRGKILNWVIDYKKHRL
jgi:hypothetical protein